MTAEESLARFGLVPADESLPAIRKMLSDEAANERNRRPREDDLALLCCVQLFSRGLLEDVLRIWDAKSAGFDLGCYLDVQFLCGAGVQETRRFLADQQSPTASEVLSRIIECEKAGDFADFSPEKQLEQYRHYFRST